MADTILNKDLIYKQGLLFETVEELEKEYAALDKILNSPHLVSNPVKAIENMEYTLQELWGFEKDSRKHKYWMYVKGCTCPRLDNYDRIGTGTRVYNGDCPWHSVGVD